jgi:hypothetical protein
MSQDDPKKKRACDRCGAERGVRWAFLSMHHRGARYFQSRQRNLCRECLEVLAQIIYAEPWEAPTILRILDGEPPPELAEKARDAFREIRRRR